MWGVSSSTDSIVATEDNIGGHKLVALNAESVKLAELLE